MYKDTAKQITSLRHNYRSKSPAFTIVELLIVIVVIGILAAIIIVSYTGIRQRAIVSSLQSDLSNVSTQLKLYQVTNDAYPTSNDCSSGPNPAPPKICLKASSGNSYIDYIINNNNPQTFCVAEDNSGVDYKITNGFGPVVGRCVTVTTNPSGLIANGGTGQVILSWIAPSDNGGSAITGYKVYQGTSAGSETLLATIGNVLTYTNTGLSTGATYYYKVTAINSIGESGYSNEASGTTNPITYTLTTVAGTGGTVSSGGTYSSGSTPTITASPNTYYSFSSWSGSTGCSGAFSHIITIDANKTCTANFSIDPNWIAGLPSTVMAGKFVRSSDLGVTFRYKNTATPLTSPQGAIGLDPSLPSYMSLVDPQANPAVDFSAYDAQSVCKTIGGRLPNFQELQALYAGRYSYGNNFQAYNHWSATEYNDNTSALYISFNDGSSNEYGKTAYLWVRCVAG